MKKYFISISILALFLFSSCKKENNRIANNNTGKIKSIRLVSHYSVSDSSVTQFDFYYKSNGLLDSFVYNGISIILDSLDFSYNSNLLYKSVNKKSNSIPDYEFFDSILYTYNSANFLQNLEQSYTETDACFNKNYIDSFYYNSNNLSRYVSKKDNLGCTAGSYFTDLNTYSFFYNLSKNSSVNNENIGMPYCGKSSFNVVDSVFIEICNDMIAQNNFNCFSYGVKINNTYDVQGRIIKTNYIPMLGFMFVKREFTLLPSNNNDLYEISYY